MTWSSILRELVDRFNTYKTQSETRKSNSGKRIRGGLKLGPRFVEVRPVLTRRFANCQSPEFTHVVSR